MTTTKIEPVKVTSAQLHQFMLSQHDGSDWDMFEGDTDEELIVDRPLFEALSKLEIEAIVMVNGEASVEASDLAGVAASVAESISREMVIHTWCGPREDGKVLVVAYHEGELLID